MSQKRPRLGLQSLVLATVTLALAAPAAAASTASVEGGTLTVTAGPGEVNDVTISQSTEPGSETPSEYTVRDNVAGATAGPGCTPAAQGAVSCAAGGVLSVVIRLGDGDDTANAVDVDIPASAYGEAGNDHLTVSARTGTLADGGEGDDNLDQGDDLRGGPGNDRITGSRLLDGGDGNDALRKTGAKVGGRLVGGSGDDALQSDDGWPDELQCGAGTDVITNADADDRNDGTCESGKGVGGGARPRKPQVTVFELPKGRSRPGRDGRLAVWMKCTRPACDVRVRIFAAGEVDTKGFVRFRKPPLLHVTVGKKARLVHLRLTREQRRGLRRAKAYSLVGAVVITRRPGADARMITDGFYCRRASPCLDAPRGRG